MPLDEDQCKSEAVRLLWSDDMGLYKALALFAKQNRMYLRDCHVNEDYSLRNNRMESIRLRGKIVGEWAKTAGYGADPLPGFNTRQARWMVGRLKKFALQVLQCPPKISTRDGVVYFDFLVKLPEPVTPSE